MLPPFSHVQQQMPSQQMHPQQMCQQPLPNQQTQSHQMQLQQMQQTQSHQMQLQQMQQTQSHQMQPQQMQQTQYQQMQPQQMCQQQIHPQPMQQHPVFTAYPQQPQMALHLTQTDPSLPQYPQHTVAPMTAYPVSNPQFYRETRPYQIPRPRKQPSFQGINASPQATPLPEPYKTRKILMAEIELLLADKRAMQEQLDAIVKQRDVLLDEKITHAAEKLDFERRLRDKEDNSAEQHGMQQQINLVVQERDVLASQKLTLLAEKTEIEKQLRSKEDKLDEYRHTVAEQAADLRKLTMQIVDLISRCGKNHEDDDSISNKSAENDDAD